MNLDEQQQAVVELPEGRYSIIAGAGAGKTACLIERIQYLLKKGISPFDMTAITFTRTAAKEMQERLGNPLVDVRTVHSLCYKILKREMKSVHPELHPFEILSGYRQKKMLRQSLERVNIDPTEMKLFLQEISKAKNKCEDHLEDGPMTLAWAIYESSKRKEKYLDLDDLLVYSNDILEDELIRDRYRVKYLFVDEAHDISRIQHDIIQKLDGGNLLLVSSVEQCIYEWRTAEPSLILNIQERYPDIQFIKLSTNYRSADEIVNAANNLISGSVYKSLRMRGTGKGGKIEYRGLFQSIEEELDTLTNRISGDSNAILFRTRWYSLYAEQALRKAHLPYHTLSGHSFFDAPEIQDMIAYLKLSVTDDPDAFLRVYNRPNRYLGNAWRAHAERCLFDDMSIDELLSQTFQSANSRELNIWRKGQASLHEILRAIRGAGPLIVIDVVRRHYDEWWAKECDLNDGDDLEPCDQLDAFTNYAAEFRSAQTLLETMNNPHQQNNSGVAVGTVHAAKCREWDTVYGVGITEGLIPHSKSSNLEEERRIFYVLITRAKENLILSSARHRHPLIPLTESRFLHEMS